MITPRRLLLVAATTIALHGSVARAQDILPIDNTESDYHPSPRYRESESHPLRILAYALHPVGWVLREAIFRPLSYFASSTPETRAVMGYREPYDFRQPSCFSRDQGTPDCRQISPFNYDSNVGKVVEAGGDASQQQALYFPDTNFDFNKRSLNSAGKEKVRVAADVLRREGFLKVVLEGHTDSRGSEAYNQKLGLDRAEAVRNELVAQGIPVDTVSTISFGETRPLFTEKEDWAYAANRRVHVRVGEEVESAVAAPVAPKAVEAVAPKVEAKPVKAKAAKKIEPKLDTAAVPAQPAQPVVPPAVPAAK
jgi:outer membrane protein OmpA-like peptidoglycan-associated protein